VKRVIDDKLSSGRRHGYAPVVSVLFAVAVVTAAAARTPVTINLGHPPDGQQDVSQADAFGRARKISEGRAFIEKLRARSRDGRGLDERLSVDMAEYAFLRHDFNANRDRCLACLKAVYDAAPSSFWGWAAYTFLTDAGVTVPRPTPDPLRGLGAFGDGVVNLQPARLRARRAAGNGRPGGAAFDAGTGENSVPSPLDGGSAPRFRRAAGDSARTFGGRVYAGED
jgi:hypothetical protein